MSPQNPTAGNAEALLDSTAIRHVLGDVSRSTLLRLQNAGLPSVTLPGTSLRRFDPAQCLAWIAQQQPTDRPAP